MTSLGIILFALIVPRVIFVTIFFLLLTSKKFRYTIATSRAKDKVSSKKSFFKKSRRVLFCNGGLIVGQAVNLP